MFIIIWLKLVKTVCNKSVNKACLPYLCIQLAQGTLILSFALSDLCALTLDPSSWPQLFVVTVIPSRLQAHGDQQPYKGVESLLMHLLHEYGLSLMGQPQL
jgi:hypothetical protein